MGERKHAILPASGAARWMACTPSARLEEQFPDTGSEYAAEGTLAHSMAELKVRKKFIEPMGPRKYNTHMNKLKKDPLFQEEMDRCTDDYLDYVSKVYMSYKTAPTIAVEHKLDLSRYAPESFGTGDCITINSEVLHVIDFKYGKGVVVDAEHNPQLMLYGLGALDAYGLFYNPSRVILNTPLSRRQTCRRDIRRSRRRVMPRSLSRDIRRMPRSRVPRRSIPATRHSSINPFPARPSYKAPPRKS